MDKISSAVIPPMMQTASTVFTAMGQSSQGDAAMEAGRRKMMSAQSQAAQLDRNATQQVAASQRGAEDDQRQTQLAMSRALAVAAASGGGASDPTIVNTIARLAGEGAYRSMSTLYQGQEQARAMRDQAAMSRYSGDVAMADAKTAKDASTFSAMATLAPTVLKGASSMYKKYGAASKTNDIWLDI